MTDDLIADAVAALRAECHLPTQTARRGPVLLDHVFEELAVAHFALPELTRGTVADHLCAAGVTVGDLGDAKERLAGYVFVAGRIGWAFVSAADPLPRRRFTAAHELGHFVLHRGAMGGFRADTEQSLREADEDSADQRSAAPRWPVIRSGCRSRRRLFTTLTSPTRRPNCRRWPSGSRTARAASSA